MSLLDWSVNPSNNGVVAGVQYWPEGMLPGQVNDTGRQMMADVATWLTAPTFPAGANITTTGTITAGIVNVTGGSVSISGSSDTVTTYKLNGVSRVQAGYSVSGDFFYVNRYNTDGSFLGTPLKLSRATGNATFESAIAAVNAAFSGNLSVAGTVFFSNDPNFCAFKDGSGNPVIQFGSGILLKYNYAAAKLYLTIGGVQGASIDASFNIRTTGQFIAATTP